MNRDFSQVALSFQNIEFSITLKDITKFERLNDVFINVYGIEGHDRPIEGKH